jgi:hypothetical protein
MKTKVLKALKPKAASLGFTEEELEESAATIAGNLKEDATDEQVTQAVDAALPFLKMSQKAATRIVNAEKEKSKKEKDEAKKKADEEEAAKKKEINPDPKDDTPAWAKALIEQNKALSEKVESLSGERVAEKRKASFSGILEGLTEKQKNSILADFNRLQFKDDDDFNSYLEEKKKHVADLIQENADAGISKVSKPKGAKGSTEEKPPKEVLDRIKERETAKVAPPIQGLPEANQ